LELRSVVPLPPGLVSPAPVGTKRQRGPHGTARCIGIGAAPFLAGARASHMSANKATVSPADARVTKVPGNGVNASKGARVGLGEKDREREGSALGVRPRVELFAGLGDADVNTTNCAHAVHAHARPRMSAPALMLSTPGPTAHAARAAVAADPPVHDAKYAAVS
jgi:hypothetical protein